MSMLCNTTGLEVNVSPKVDFVEDNKGELIPPKIQGVRVIVDAMKGINSYVILNRAT